MNTKLKKLNRTIIKCRKCPRLTKFIKKVSTEKKIGRAHVRTPVTEKSRMPSSA